LDNDKKAELKKYRDLVIATIDYYLDFGIGKIKTADFDSDEHYKSFKIKTEESFQKGRLTRLKQWFRDLTEMMIETVDLKFNNYVRSKTGYDIDIFKSFYDRIDKIIEKGKITSDNQFYDVNILVNELSQSEQPDIDKIDKLNKLLVDFEQGGK
jgi:hypothetical protein